MQNIKSLDDLLRVKQKEEVTYFTFNGSEDKIIDGKPVRRKKDKYAYASQSGNKYMIKIDDRGQFMNPRGMYKQEAKYDRWINVSEKVFNYYLSFLKTGNKLYLTHAERENV